MLEKQKKSGGIIKDESMVTGELAGKPPLSALKADYWHFPRVPFTRRRITIIVVFMNIIPAVSSEISAYC